MTRWTAEQVEGLAPDAASLRAAGKLAVPASWATTGVSAAAVWGLARGSGKRPYEVAVDLAGPAYRCSCPSRKIPCKHVLGLLLLWASAGVPEGEPEPFVDEWLRARADRAHAATKRAADGPRAPSDPVARDRRADRRAQVVAEGCADLGRWLEDLIGQGLAAGRERPAAGWDDQARRLVDAQAPALGDEVRRLASVVHAGAAGWQRDALERAGRLAVAAEAWARVGDLPDAPREDLRARTGWPRPLDEVRALPSDPGPWAVAGRRVVTEGRLRGRRTWLVPTAGGDPALVLDFAPAGGGFADPGHIVGRIVAGPMHRFPGSGLRVAPGSGLEDAGAWSGPEPGATVGNALAAWGRALAADPLCERLVVALAGVVPVRDRGAWWLRDAAGDALPIAAPTPWELVAASGGDPVGVTAEWDGRNLRPLCGWTADGVAAPVADEVAA